MDCTEQYKNLGKEESQLRSRHGPVGSGPRGPDCSRCDSPAVLVPEFFLDVIRHHGHALGALMGGAMPSYLTQCSDQEGVVRAAASCKWVGPSQ